MTVTLKSQEKEKLMQQLGRLLDVAGTETPWKDLSEALRRLPMPMLRALHYRVERVMGDSYEQGQRSCR